MQVLNVTDFDGHFEAKGVPSILALTLGPPSPVTSTFWIVLDRASGSPSNSLFFVYFPGSMLV